MSSLDKYIKNIASVAKFLWERGWAESNAGNISINVSFENTFLRPKLKSAPYFPLTQNFIELSNFIFLVTGSGTRMRDVALHPEDTLLLLFVDKKGDGYYVRHLTKIGKYLEPTSELLSHLRVHQFIKKNNRPERVVLHTHPTELIALTHNKDINSKILLNNLIFQMYPEASVIDPYGIGLVPYFITGSNALANATVEALQSHRIILWEKHGCLAISENISNAFDLIDVMNKAAILYLKCRSAGYLPEGLSSMDVEELRNKFWPK